MCRLSFVYQFIQICLLPWWLCRAFASAHFAGVLLQLCKLVVCFGVSPVACSKYRVSLFLACVLLVWILATVSARCLLTLKTYRRFHRQLAWQRPLIFALLSIILLGVISVLILKNNAKAYARHLFPIYLTL